MTNHKLPKERDLPAARHSLRKAHLMTMIEQETASAPVRPHRRWLGLAILGTTVAAALAIGVPALLGQGATPANAVIREPDGSIKIYVRDYKHPEVIERQLRNLDVQADVTFLPTGKQCKEPRGTYLPDNPALLTTEPPAEGEDAYWRLHPEQIKPGQTFVYTMWYEEHGDNRMASGLYRVVTGPVAPCEVVPGGPVMQEGPEGGVGG
ncbi:hypothetical protein [Streptosporangium sp. NPDC000396]|uniref:hypothetical protein n=1 Tax=Streptosporangium sp. NPDC000396 TaxID=3366185 RepID=UPI003691591F